MKNHIRFYENGCVEILYSKSNHSFPLHSHECFCIGIVLSGEVDFNINNHERLLHKPTIFIIPSNTGVKITTTSSYEYVTICFKKHLKEKTKQLNFNNYYFDPEDSNDFISLCNKFKADNDEINFFNSILKIVQANITSKDLTFSENKNDLIPRICRYIIKNADKKFNLDELANEFHISKFYLIRIFKKEMSVTPNQYYMQAKLRILKSEILKNKSETNLAMDLSLSDESHLCKMFRKYMGISIQNYKKNYNSK